MSSLLISHKQAAFHVLTMACKYLGYGMALDDQRSIDRRSVEYHGEHFTLELACPDHCYEIRFDGKQTFSVLVSDRGEGSTVEENLLLSLTEEEKAQFLPLIQKAYDFDKPVAKKTSGSEYCGA